MQRRWFIFNVTVSKQRKFQVHQCLYCAVIESLIRKTQIKTLTLTFRAGRPQSTSTATVGRPMLRPWSPNQNRSGCVRKAAKKTCSVWQPYLVLPLFIASASVHLSLSTSSHNLIKHELSGCRRRSVSLLGYRLVSRAYGIGVGFVAVVVVWFMVPFWWYRSGGGALREGMHLYNSTISLSPYHSIQ